MFLSGPAVMPATFGVRRRDGVLGDAAHGRDAADGVDAAGLGEPQVAVGAGRDGVRPAARGNAELGDGPRRRDAADVVGVVLGEPQVAVGAGRDRVREARRAWGWGTR